jgi:excisionase family DNA binding protein
MARSREKVLELIRERDAAAREQQRRTISIEEAGLALGIGRSSAYAYAKSGALPVVKVGKRMRIHKAKFEQLLEGV